MNLKALKIISIGIFLFITICAIWQFFYVQDMEKKADPAYMAQEQELERQKEIERREFVEAVNRNPKVLEEEKMEAEKRREMEREMFKTREDMISIKEVNDYMKEITEDELKRDMASIENNLSIGNIDGAKKTTDILMETYNLNDYPEETKVLRDVARVNDINHGESAVVNFACIEDARMYIYAFLFADRDTQAKIVVDKCSEVVAFNGGKIEIGEPDNFSIVESGILSVRKSTEGYTCYRVPVTIDGAEYYCYMLYRKLSRNWEILKFLDKEASSRGIGENTYEAYISYTISDDEKQTYGIKWRG